MTFSPEIDRLLASCDELQRAAITSPAKPLLVVASAGSGKTRVLTRRIARQVLAQEIVADHVLALTFTRKAAAELRDRLSQLGLSQRITAGTFHAVGLAQLRRRATDDGRPLPVVLASKARILGEVVPDHSFRHRETQRPIERREVLSMIASEIEWSRARMIPPEHYQQQARAAQRPEPIDADLVAAAYANYEREKRRRRVLDFDDLLSEITRSIAEDPEFAAVQRWRFRHFFVDEFQDASPAQLALLEAWLGERPDLFAVGDPRQAIYGWNGADASGVTDFAGRFTGATTINLEVNYRSTPQVVAVATAALPRDDRRALVTPRADGRVPSLSTYEDDQVEAREIAHAIRRAHQPGRRWSEFAVLTRTNAQLRLFAEAFQRAGIPARLSDARSFLAIPVVEQALRAMESCDDRTRFAAWMDDTAEEIAAARREAPEINLEEAPKNDSHLIDLETLVRLARDYAELDAYATTGPGCITYLRESLRSDPLSRASDAVDLMTFHRAKGLEWPAVWVAGLEDGFVPIGYAASCEALDEERRLLYVALSRAGDELHCSWSRVRHFGQRALDRQASPWLVSIDNACRVLARGERINHELAAQALAESRASLARGRQE